MRKIFKGKFFAKTLLVIGTSISFIVLCLCIIFYIYNVNNIIKHSYTSNQEKMMFVRNGIEKELQIVKNGTSEVVVNRNIIQSIYNKKLENDYEKIIPLNQKLIDTSLILEDVYSIELYLQASQLLISSKNGTTPFDQLTSQYKDI